MKILVVGSGGREHALAWKFAQSERVSEVFVAPGNGGTALASNLTNVDIAVMDFDGLSDFAIERGITLTVVGPEAPLVAGIEAHFVALGLQCLALSELYELQTHILNKSKYYYHLQKILLL